MKMEERGGREGGRCDAALSAFFGETARPNSRKTTDDKSGDEPSVGTRGKNLRPVPIMRSDEGSALHVGLVECGWERGRGSYIHAEFTVQDELKFLIREGASAQYGLTESREPVDTESRAW